MQAKRLTYDAWLIRSVLFHYIQHHNLPVSTGGLIGLGHQSALLHGQ